MSNIQQRSFKDFYNCWHLGELNVEFYRIEKTLTSSELELELESDRATRLCAASIWKSTSHQFDIANILLV